MHPLFKIVPLAMIGLMLIVFAPALRAQSLRSNVRYEIDFRGATKGPVLGRLPPIKFPEDAIKTGTEGTLIAEMNLAADGKVKDYKFIETLPNGYEQAIIDAFNALIFEPAKRNGEPVDIILKLEFTVSLVYDADDKNVTKPIITKMPTAVYPESERAEKWKGVVEVAIVFNKDGTHTVLSTGSTMPKPFAEAALKAVEGIEFSPAQHKDTMKPVSMVMSVEFKFEP